ncbi:DUF2318 domain-containing protein [Propionispira raffinosivorans]|uniref:DUF2318 domain-containing protein n=1 Tax=Propionispira raffinosivorans TaxID=86959 RepID=UPI00036B0381|nr:DUF2318 domain-containing protein [Propionispira raffinosivorans]
MLQMILQNLVPAMELAVTLIVPLAILLALLMRMQPEAYKKIFFRGISWGFWGSFFIILVKIGTKNAVSREVFESLTSFLALFAEVAVLWPFYFSKSIEKTLQKSFKIALYTMIITLTLYHGMEILLIPVSVFVSAVDVIWSMTVLWKMIGFLVGLLLAGISGVIIFRAAAALNYRRLLFVFTVQIITIIFQQVIFLIQVMMARSILPGEYLMSGMAVLIDHQSWFIFIVFAVTFILPITLFLQKRPQRPKEANPAQYRRIRSVAKRKLRWGMGTILCLCLMLFVSTEGSMYVNKTEELVPAVAVTALDGNIQIPLEQVNDGHLHRYVYKASTGELVRFIIIQKGGSAYGVGLDACEICGPTGYLERDGQVVCRLCDVVMNKATIGMKGGCNPIPIAYKVMQGNVMVEQSGLETEKSRFK